MTVDLVCFYAEVGMGERYQPLMAKMTETARAQMPDSRVILLSPNPPPSKAIHKLFDKSVLYPEAVEQDDVIFHKGRALMWWACATKNVTAFVDPDIEFLKPIAVDDSFDVALNWRKGRWDQPVNAGLIVTAPNLIKFWMRFGQILHALPPKNRRWYCEQLALSLMVGVNHKPDTRLELFADEGPNRTRVWLRDSVEHCAPPEFAQESTRAIHRKGRRKGPGWEGMFPEAGEKDAA